MLNEELSDKERQYSELEEEWKAEKASLSGTQTIKAELEQAKIAIEQARRVGDLARMSELQYGKIPELEKQLEAATQLEGKTMRLLRNKVTDAEIAGSAGALDGDSGFSHDGKRARKTAAYGARTAPSRNWSERSG